MKRPRALVFDLDDTLYPERSYVLSGFRAVAEWAGARLDITAEQVYAELVGLHDRGIRGDTFDRWLEGRGVSTEGLLSQMIQAYRDHWPSLRPFDGALSLLLRLRGPFLLGLVTDGYGSVQRLKLEALGLGRLFDAIVFTDDLGRQAWKPSPAPFEVIADRLGILAPEAVYIADNPLKDFFGPRSLGMRTIRIRYKGGYHAHDEPPTPQHAPDISLSDLGGLEGALLINEEKKPGA